MLVKQNCWATRLSEFSHSPDTFCCSGSSTGVETSWLSSFFSVILGLKHTWMFVSATLSLDTGRKRFLFKVQTHLTRIVQILLFMSWDNSGRLLWSTRNTFVSVWKQVADCSQCVSTSLAHRGYELLSSSLPPQTYTLFKTEHCIAK